MITDLWIQGLRGVREGELHGLGPLVVLVGPNGCGKSTLLDALLIGGASKLGEAVGRTVQRRAGSWNGSRWLFSRSQEEKSAKVRVGEDGDQGRVEREVTVKLLGEQERDPAVEQQLVRQGRPQPITGVRAQARRDGNQGDSSDVLFAADNSFLVKTWFLDRSPPSETRLVDSPQSVNVPLDEVYTQAVERGRKAQADASLRQVLGGQVKGVTLLTDNRVPVVHVEFEDGSVPVSVSGEGVASLVRIALEMGGHPGGTVLLEEPEAHQHPKILWRTAELIWVTVVRGVQVVLTTHSLELLDALIATAPAEHLRDLSVYRVNLSAGRLVSTRISGEDAATQRADFEDDLR